MGSEIQSERAKQAQQLKELQEAYSKRRKAAKQQGDAELAHVETENARRLHDENRTGEAAINHVREQNAEKLQELESQGNRRVTYERRDLKKNYQTEKDQSDEQLKQLHESLEERQAHLEAEMHKLKMKENEIRANESDVTNKMERQEYSRRQKINEKLNDELQADFKRGQTEKSKLKRAQAEDTQHLIEKHNETMHELADENRTALEKQTRQAQSQLKSRQTEDSKRIEAERAQFLNDESTLRDRAQTNVVQERDKAAQDYRALKTKDNLAIEHERQAGTKGMEKSRSYYADQVARIQKRGQEAVHTEKADHEYRMKILKDDNTAELNRTKQAHEEDIQRENLRYKEHRQHDEAAYTKALLQQKKSHDKQIQANLDAFTTAVNEQKEHLTDSLMREKRGLMEDVGKYQSRESDPFYHLTDPNAAVKETDKYYILQAKVPKYEKDNVKVIVKDNKLVVHGERRFADHIKDKGSSISTHSYQTFRQEIPLEHPVKEKLAEKSWDDGILTIKIPKA